MNNSTINAITAKWLTILLDYEKIKREGIRVVEGVVITHYLLNLSWIDDEGVNQTRESRITHTWIKEGSQWKILGGMSNRN